MPIAPPDADAAFFNLMHSFLAAPQQAEGRAGDPRRLERRDISRRAFRIKQRIAPGYCWEVPPEEVWIDVLCCDLTQGGFSFFLDDKPEYGRLVAMFRPDDPIYVAARVNYCRPVLVDDEGHVLDPTVAMVQSLPADRPRESKFLIGCQFLRRFGRV
jgi:hypothetical protein